jgi:hypothetical protein
METENFVREQNVLRFSQLLETEHDPIERERLCTLLLNEENKFAATVDRLTKTDGHIAECRRQYGLIDKLKMDGHDIEAAERLLRNLMDLHDIYVSHRRSILEGLNRNGL